MSSFKKALLVSSLLGFIDYAHCQILQHIGIWMPGGEWQDTASGTQYAPGGQTLETVVEIQDSADAFQFLFGNNTSISETVTAVFTPSAAYGPSANATEGITPYDSNGNALNNFLPVLFDNGMNSTPWSNADNTINGNQVLSLTTSAATAPGSGSTLTFASTNSNAITGGAPPQVGMFVSNSLGSFSPNCAINSVSATQVVLNGSCSISQTIALGSNVYFSWSQRNQQFVIPASTNPPQIQFIPSAWMHVSTVPRSDGGEAIGDFVSAPSCFPSGGTITAVGYNYFRVDNGHVTNNTCPAGTPISFGLTYNVGSAGAANGAYFIPMSNTTNLTRGMIPSGTNIPLGANITQISSSGIRLSLPITGALTSSNSITFTSTTWVYKSALNPGQNTVVVRSTSTNPLILVRMNVSSTGSVNYWPDAGTFTQQYLPDFDVNYSSPSSVDGINIPSNITNSTSGITQDTTLAFYGIKFACRHACKDVITVGDSHVAGDQAPGGNSGYTRFAAAALSTPTNPVTIWNLAQSGKSMLEYGFSADLAIKSLASPATVVISGWTTNYPGNDTPQSYISKVEALCEEEIYYGGNCIITTDMPRSIKVAYGYNLASSSTGTNVINLLSPLGLTFGAGYLVSNVGTTTCIPAGTTLSASAGYALTSMVLSNNVTCSSTDQVTLGIDETSSSVTNTTVIPLAYPLPSGTFYNITSSTPTNSCLTGQALTGNQGDMQVTLTTPCSVAANTFLSIGVIQPANYLMQTEQAVGMDLNITGGNQLTFDAYSPCEDPNNPGNYKEGYSWSGVHGSLQCNELIGSDMQSVLSTALGLQ